MAEATYASNGKANAALTTGIIGTTLGGIAAAGGLGAILGIHPGGPPPDPGDRPVTRYEMGLHNENRDLRDRITVLEANGYTDRAAAGLQRQIDGQGAVNAAMTATLQAQQGQIAQLMGITKLVVPNDNLSPGYGRAAVAPAPPPMPPWVWGPWGPWMTPPTQQQGANGTGGTETTQTSQAA